MKKLLGVMLLALVLTGCGSKEEKSTTICKGNIDELTATEVTIEATDDKTDVMKSHVVYDLTSYVSEELPIDTYWLAQVKSINIDFNSLDGAKAKYSVDGEKIILDVEINYDEADFDQLKDAGLITTGKDGKVVYISLEQTIKEQEKAGLTCKKQ